MLKIYLKFPLLILSKWGYYIMNCLFYMNKIESMNKYTLYVVLMVKKNMLHRQKNYIKL